MTPQQKRLLWKFMRIVLIQAKKTDGPLQEISRERAWEIQDIDALIAELDSELTREN